jgi:predicted transposase YbfD/YdcC
MPAAPSSLFALPVGSDVAPDPVRLVAVLRAVPDPRQRRGVRYSSAALLAAAVAAVLAGAKSFRAIAEWIDDAPTPLLHLLGLLCRPSEKTIRLLIEHTDDAVLSRILAAWLGNRAPRRSGRRLIAVDGKTTRGARSGDERAPHLLAALEHTTGVVLGQVQVDGKTNEISAFSVLLDQVDIAGAVVTADALHTQNGHAEYLAGRGADWVFTVKGNRPKLRTELQALPWHEVDVAAETRGKGHGRLEWRSLKVVTVSRGIGFPHAAQAIQLIRRTRRPDSNTWHREVVYAITSMPAERVQGVELLTILRRHWAIENELHWVRDVTFGEDASRVRTGTGPAVMAAIRNLAISLAHLEDIDSIATFTRRNARRPARVAALLNTG